MRATRRPQAGRRRNAVFGAMADPTRRRILELLGERPLPAGDIAGRFPRVSRPAVSRHLRVLRRAHLVSGRRIGRIREYHLSPGPLRGVDEWIAQFEGFWEQVLAALTRCVEEAP